MARVYKTDYGYMGLGQRIRKLRAIMDMTQHELSLQTYIPGFAICKIERGEIPVTEKRLKAFARVFGYEPGDLLQEEIEVKI